MKPIASLCKDLKSGKPPLRKHLNRPVASWSESDRYHDDIIKAFVIILKTKGCSWAQESGCTMCGYFNDSAFSEVTNEQLLSQFHTAMASYHGEPVVKIFTSGSFFDSDEIPVPVRETILTELSQKTEKTAVESRPEYITPELLDGLSDCLSTMKLEVGIGLETITDSLRDLSINKGFTYDDYRKAASLLKHNNHLIKTYVLVKPPFLTEQQSITETLNTITAINDITDTISINPTNIQKRTLVEYLWKRHYYRPPWLWSIIEILSEASQITSKRIQCDIVGGGSIRGAHNCKTCDKPVSRAIQQFSLSQDPNNLVTSDCACKSQWKDQLMLEQISFGSLPDVQRGLIA